MTTMVILPTCWVATIASPCVSEIGMLCSPRPPRKVRVDPRKGEWGKQRAYPGEDGREEGQA